MVFAFEKMVFVASTMVVNGYVYEHVHDHDFVDVDVDVDVLVHVDVDVDGPFKIQ